MRLSFLRLRDWSGLVGALWAGLASSPVRADDWPFDDQYESTLLFLHAYLDYAFHPLWEREWERGLVAGNGLRGTAGSVSTDDLLTLVQVDVSQPIGHGFRILYVVDRNDGLHVDLGDNDQFIGLEKSVFGESGFQLLGDPASKKENLDVLLGVVVADGSRENYLRLWLRLDDPLWGRKNDRGGRSERDALGPQWTLRFARERWQLLSEGRYSRAYERVFEDESASPEIASKRRGRSESETKLRYLASPRGFVEASLAHYRYEEALDFRDPVASYAYQNRILRGRLVGGFPLGSSFQGRAELYHVRQNAKATGSHEYEYERRDYPWAVHLEWLPNPSHVGDLGYLVSHYDWDYRPTDGTTPFDNRGSVDKITASWTFILSENARAMISLSHEPEPQRFGGGNLQLQALF
jgi:hypothetical protein